MLKTFLLGCSSVVALVVLPRPEDACRLHGSTLLGAKDAFHLNASLHIESPTVVANPIVIWDFVDAVAFLVYGYVAIAAKYDQIFVLVVSIVADGTLGVLLDNEATLVRAQRVVPVDVHAMRGHLVITARRKLLKNSLVV